jgi:hypothetical protein
VPELKDTTLLQIPERCKSIYQKVVEAI